MGGAAAVGARMRKMRLARHMTQRDLAGDRYTHAYVSTIEAGRRMPSRDALEHFASRLGIEVDELVTGRPHGFETTLEFRLHEARIALSAGKADDAEAQLSATVKDARRYSLHRLEAKAEEGLGLLLERRGKPAEALERYRRAEEILKDDPPTVRVDAVGGKASCFTALGDVRYAIHLLESLLDEMRRTGLEDPDALARIHSSLVVAYLESGLYRRAAESAAELDRLAPRITEPLGLAQMHLQVARVHLARGRVPDAEAALQRAEDAYRNLHLEAEAGHAHLARGYILGRDDRLDAARADLERARAIFERTGNDRDLGRTLNELARVERLSGNEDSARMLLERSIQILAASDTPTLAWAHRELGLTMSSSDPREAEKHLRLAVELYERAEEAAETAATYRALGDLLAEGGSRDAAAEAYRTGIVALEPRL